MHDATDRTRSGSAEDRQDYKEVTKKAGKKSVEAARDVAQPKLEKGKDTAASALDSTSHALDAAASTLAGEDQATLSRAARAISHRLSAVAEAIEGRSIEELTQEARRLARENPTAFVAGGVAIGLLLSRFFKASAEHSHTTEHSQLRH